MNDSPVKFTEALSKYDEQCADLFNVAIELNKVRFMDYVEMLRLTECNDTIYHPPTIIAQVDISSKENPSITADLSDWGVNIPDLSTTDIIGAYREYQNAYSILANIPGAFSSYCHTRRHFNSIQPDVSGVPEVLSLTHEDAMLIVGRFDFFNGDPFLYSRTLGEINYFADTQSYWVLHNQKTDGLKIDQISQAIIPDLKALEIFLNEDLYDLAATDILLVKETSKIRPAFFDEDPISIKTMIDRLDFKEISDRLNETYLSTEEMREYTDLRFLNKATAPNGSKVIAAITDFTRFVRIPTISIDYSNPPAPLVTKRFISKIGADLNLVNETKGVFDPYYKKSNKTLVKVASDRPPSHARGTLLVEMLHGSDLIYKTEMKLRDELNSLGREDLQSLGNLLKISDVSVKSISHSINEELTHELVSQFLHANGDPYPDIVSYVPELRAKLISLVKREGINHVVQTWKTSPLELLRQVALEND